MTTTTTTSGCPQRESPEVSQTMGASAAQGRSGLGWWEEVSRSRKVERREARAGSELCAVWGPEQLSMGCWSKHVTSPEKWQGEGGG